MDEFDQIIKKALEEKAPAGFTDKLMEKLDTEEQLQKIPSAVIVPGKGIFIMLLGLIIAVFITLYYNKGPVESNYSYLKYIDQLLAGVHFQLTPTLKMLVFSIAAISVFLVVDYFLKSRKIVQV